MRAIGLLVVLAAIAVTGCGSDGAVRVHTAPAARARPPADPAGSAVKLDSPSSDSTLRAVRAPDGSLRTTVPVRGTAVASQTLRVQLSCPDRSCNRFVLTDSAGVFSARMVVTLPATLSRLTVDADYATIPDPRTAASVKVSVHRPRTPARHADSSTSGTSQRSPDPSDQTTTIPAPAPAAATPTVPAPATSGQATPAGTRRTMVVIGDSLAVGMQPYLGALLPGWTVSVDGRVGRPLAEGMGIVRATNLPAAGSSVLAISLFTNDDPRATSLLSAAVDQTLAEVGSGGCVIWATIARSPVGGVSYAAANALLARKAGANPRLRLVDWAAYVDDHPGTLTAGNVHPGPAGYRARAGLYAQAAAGCP